MAGTDYFRTRHDVLGVRMKQLNSYPVSYERDGVVATMQATPARQEVETISASGAITLEAKGQDFIVDRADLVLNQEAIDPQTGDEITWDGGTFRVMAIGEEVFRYTSFSRMRVRIHTKQVA